MFGNASDDVIAEVLAKIKRNGGDIRQWCVGVTDDPRNALFKIHRVQKDVDPYISRRAHDDLQAQEVVRYFVTVKGATAGLFQKDLDSVCVYAFLRQPHTQPKGKGDK